MPSKLSTTLKKLESVSENNRSLLQDFCQYIRSKGSRSERHLNDLLNLLISLDKFFSCFFTEINKKEQTLTFLDHRWNGKDWVRREHDAEGRYINSRNLYLGLLKVFFRWLVNRDKDEEDNWETPAFLKIKSKKPLRASPYEPTQIWERDEVLKIGV